jgi:hypothetical protein
MKTRGGWREALQSHEIAMKPASEMTNEELEARIRELDTALGRPLLQLKPVEIRKPAAQDPQADIIMQAR